MGLASRRSVLLLASASPLFAIAAAAEEPLDNTHAPFGLAWGMSADEVKRLGVALKAGPGRSDFGTTYLANDLGKVLSDTEEVILTFGYRDKLWRIAAVGRSIGPDPYGAAVVARYQDLANSLSARYGRGTETDLRDHELWKAPHEYLMSLKQGRAFRYTVFHTAQVNVELSVRASSGDEGYYVILYQYRPGLQEFETDKKSHERGAL